MTDDTERMVAPKALPKYARTRDGQRCYSLGYARGRKAGQAEAADLLTKERKNALRHKEMWETAEANASELIARAESAEAEAKRLREVLAELVAVSEMVPDYRGPNTFMAQARRRSAAWKSARTALAKREGGEG